MPDSGSVSRATPPSPIPAATVARLPSYLRVLRDLVARAVPTTSSAELAALSGVGSAQLRKDLSFLGSYGTRGVGYDVDSLASHIAAALGIADMHNIAIVGVGHLGSALAAYSGYIARGFRVAALFDVAEHVVGTTTAGLPVHHMDEMAQVVDREEISIVILAMPAGDAQAATDQIVAAGVREILTFAPRALHVPEDVVVRGVDVGSELQILAFHSKARALAASGVHAEHGELGAVSGQL